MWPKSIVSPPFLIIQFLVIFQISFGKPTTEEPFSRNTTTTTEPADSNVREDRDVNSSFLETVSVLLTVLSPNDTSSAAEEDDSITSPFLNNTANSTTTEPEYYDDHNLTTSSSSTLLLNELEAVADEDVDESDLDMFASSSSGVHLGSSTESSSLPSSLITEGMEVADSLDESVTATMLTSDEKDVSGNAEDDITVASNDDENDDGNRSSNSAGNNILHGSTRDAPSLSSATDDSIIIASMSSNLDADTGEPLPLSSHHHVINTDADQVPSTKRKIITSSSHLLQDDGSSSSFPESV